jgi:hypothetical protein
MNDQINPKERYEAAIYTERDGCVRMQPFEELNTAHNWLMAQLKDVKVEHPLSQRFAVIRDREAKGKAVFQLGAEYLGNRPTGQE